MDNNDPQLNEDELSDTANVSNSSDFGGHIREEMKILLNDQCIHERIKVEVKSGLFNGSNRQNEGNTKPDWTAFSETITKVIYFTSVQFNSDKIDAQNQWGCLDPGQGVGDGVVFPQQVLYGQEIRAGAVWWRQSLRWRRDDAAGSQSMPLVWWWR